MKRTKALVHAFNELRPLDQEIITLRHFDELSNSDAATALGVDPSTASQLYIRAVKRLTEQMQATPAPTFTPFSSTTHGITLNHSVTEVGGAGGLANRSLWSTSSASVG